MGLTETLAGVVGNELERAGLGKRHSFAKARALATVPLSVTAWIRRRMWPGTAHDGQRIFPRVAKRHIQIEADLHKRATVSKSPKVQRLLGHKSGLMTQRYAHHWPESLRDGVEILDRGGRFSTNLAQSGSVPAASSV